MTQIYTSLVCSSCLFYIRHRCSVVPPSYGESVSSSVMLTSLSAIYSKPSFSSFFIRHNLPHSFITSACDTCFAVHDRSFANLFRTFADSDLTNKAYSDTFLVFLGVGAELVAEVASISISLPWHRPQQCFVGSTLRLWRLMTTLQFDDVQA